MTRRQLLIAMTTALSTVTLGLKASASSKPPTGTLCGHVFGKGLRFGGLSNKFTVPGAYLLIFDECGNLFDKLFTDDDGYFEMRLLPGLYWVRYPSSDEWSPRKQYFRIESNKTTILGLS